MFRVSNNPTREEQRGKEYDLASLPLAGRFVSRGILGGADTYGTLLEVTPGRCVVAVSRPPKHVKIGSAEFDTAASATTSWPHNVPVEYLGQDDNYEIEGDNSALHEEITMARKSATNASNAVPASTTTEAPVAAATSNAAPVEVDPNHDVVIETAPAAAPAASFITTAAEAVAANEGNPKAKVVISRWLFTTGKLESLLKAAAAAEILNPVRTAVTNVYDQAVENGVILPMVSAELMKDDTFTGMRLGVAPESAAAKSKSKRNGKAKKAAAATSTESTTNNAEAATAAPVNEESAMPTATAKKKVAATTGKRAVKKATAAAKKSAQPREKKEKVLAPCGCGCGEQVPGNFRQGHDARYKGRLLRIERGEETPKDLPSGMLKYGGRDGQPLEFKKSGDGMKCTNSRLNH